MVESLSIEVGLEGSEEFQRNAALIQKGLVDCAVSVRNFAAEFATIGTVVGIVAAGALVKFANAAEDTEKALTQLQRVSGASFENLSALQQVFAAGGTTLNKFSTEFAKLSSAIQDANIARYTRQWGDWDKEFTKSANDLDTLRGKFDNLARGAAVTFSPLSKFQNQLEALKESLAEVTDPQAQYLKLADIFRTLSQQGAAGVIQMQRFGEALKLSPETIQTLSQGSEAIRATAAEAERLGLTLTASNQQALQQMGQGWNQFTTLLSAAFQKIAAAAAPAFAALLDISKQALKEIVRDFQTLPLDQAMANLGQRVGTAFAAMWPILQPIFAQLGEQLVAMAETIGLAIGKAIILGMIPGILQGKGPIADAIKQLFTLGTADIGPAGGTQPGGAAAGGLIGGIGTGTSDSNLAWVSRGEYITPARAVAQPGVLAFLEALRQSGGSLSRVLNGMGHFALGGLVRTPIPAFAAGGLVGGNNVVIQFPGLPAISGLRASADTVEELRRAAALAQVRSGGRKPSRYS